jgi:hypothetical protein
MLKRRVPPCFRLPRSTLLIALAAVAPDSLDPEHAARVASIAADAVPAKNILRLIII